MPMNWRNGSPFCDRRGGALSGLVTMPPVHRFGWPDRHCGQVPQNPDRQATIWSPARTLVTSSPTASTTPAPSWPSTIGRSVGKRPTPSTTCRSLWQTPVATVRTNTSRRSGLSTSTVSIVRGACGLRKTAASICIGTSSTGARICRKRVGVKPGRFRGNARRAMLFGLVGFRSDPRRSGVTEIEIRERASPNHGSRGEPPNVRPINMLVLHYTGMQSAEAALDRLCDPEAQVSAHYLVEENGTIWRLVVEERRAFHAGISCWLGEHGLNDVSIGIEIVNPGHEWGYREFPEPQMQAVEALCRDIVARRHIPPYRIVGHSDIAPDRKSDPGELFNWQRLARAGIGMWPPSSPDVARRRGRGVGVIHRTAALSDLARIGYCVSRGTERIALAAFQRRFRPERWDGLLDLETSLRLRDVRLAVEAAQATEAVRLRNRFN